MLKIPVKHPFLSLYTWKEAWRGEIAWFTSHSKLRETLVWGDPRNALAQSRFLSPTWKNQVSSKSVISLTLLQGECDSQNFNKSISHEADLSNTGRGGPGALRSRWKWSRRQAAQGFCCLMTTGPNYHLIKTWSLGWDGTTRRSPLS